MTSLHISYDRATCCAILQPRVWLGLASRIGGYRLVRDAWSWVADVNYGRGAGYRGGWTFTVGWRAKRLGEKAAHVMRRDLIRVTVGGMVVQWTYNGHSTLVPHGWSNKTYRLPTWLRGAA